VARHGNPKFPRAWAPGHDLETPKCLRRAEPPNFRRDMETPSFPRLGRRGATWKPQIFSAGRNPQILGATWKPQVSPGLGATWKPQVFSDGMNRRDMETPSFPRLGRDLETPNFQRRAEQARHGNPKFPQAWARLGNPKFLAPGGTPKF
jgi:hypothetical protein